MASWGGMGVAESRCGQLGEYQLDGGKSLLWEDIIVVNPPSRVY